MYSTAIEDKVDKMFSELQEQTREIVAYSSSMIEAATSITRLVSMEVSTRSKTILSDMIYELNDSLLKTEFFSDITKQNAYFRAKLQDEIMGKYQFTPSESLNYDEASRILQSLKFSGATLVVGGAIEVGVVLISSLTFSSLVPIPISVLIIASIGVALADYYVIEPARNKKDLVKALDEYLMKAKQQFLNWFDEVEKYFNKRVEEIKQTL